jgi:DNA-binding NtrC family response regulator
LFRGETGTGKRLFATYSHRQRITETNDVPFFVVNCPQISQELFASELFGHRKGAFTDAREDKPGVIEKANGGDVFLDEIAELPPGVQAGILKVIEERAYNRVGETTTRSVDVRFLSATNSTLVGFREDLLMRLTEGGTINLPPLRERKDDIHLLVEKFVRDAEKTTQARERRIEPEAITKLMHYNWPGNVRELQNRIYEAVQQYSKLPYLVPEHINLPEEYTQHKIGISQAPVNIPEPVKINISGFTEYALPQILQEQHKKVVQYIISALEYCRDRRNDEPNYPKTWHAMTGEDVKSSSTCQRNIGNYIFQLNDGEIIRFMKDSSVFHKAVFQCGNKIKSVVRRLSEFEKRGHIDE